jgi:hypothetical protein
MMAANRRPSTFENAKTLYFIIHLEGPITKAEILADTGWSEGKFATAFAYLRDGLDLKGVPINYDPREHTYNIPAAVDWELSQAYQIHRLRILIKQMERGSKHLIASSSHHPQMKDQFLGASNKTLQAVTRLEQILTGWTT